MDHFTDDELELYWKVLREKSVSTGINIDNLFRDNEALNEDGTQPVHDCSK